MRRTSGLTRYQTEDMLFPVCKTLTKAKLVNIPDASKMKVGSLQEKLCANLPVSHKGKGFNFNFFSSFYPSLFAG